MAVFSWDKGYQTEYAAGEKEALQIGEELTAEPEEPIQTDDKPLESSEAIALSSSVYSPAEKGGYFTLPGQRYQAARYFESEEAFERERECYTIIAGIIRFSTAPFFSSGRFLWPFSFCCM